MHLDAMNSIMITMYRILALMSLQRKKMLCRVPLSKKREGKKKPYYVHEVHVLTVA